MQKHGRGLGRRLIACLSSILLLWGFHTLVSYAQSMEQTYQLVIGPTPNMEGATISFMDGSALLFDTVHRVATKRPMHPAVGATFRVANVALVQLYLGGLMYGTLLHEHFGHKARARELGLPLTLELNFPALGGDFRFPVTQRVPAAHRQYVLAAGYEATSFVAYQAVRALYSQDEVGTYMGNFMLAGKLIEGILTFNNDLGPFLDNPNAYYASNIRLRSNPIPNDPLGYVLALTERYGYYDAHLDSEANWVERLDDLSVYTNNTFIHDQRRRLRRAFLRSALDPALLYFALGNYGYLVQGKAVMQSYMVRLGRVAFMPSIRASYGELGAENYYDVFFRVEDGLPFNVYYRRGGNLFDSITGAGFEVREMVRRHWRLGIQGDYWHNSQSHSNHINLFVTAQRFWARAPFFMSIGLGYKSRGALMAKPLDRGLYGYVGGGLRVATRSE